MTQPDRAPADAALEALRNGRAGRPVMTSLTVDEAILLDQVGYEPLGMVTGASVVRVGQLGRWATAYNENGEVESLSQASTHARRTAVANLVREAQSLGADGVVSVGTDAGEFGTEGNLVHMVVTGTAVRLADSKLRRTGSGSRSHEGCFTAAMNGQAVHLLSRAGYAPLGIVSGVCAYHVGRRAFSSWASSVKQNQEMSIYTEALYDARELAMSRLQDESLAHGADGVIGLNVTERAGIWGSHVIEFAALGTAVRLVAGEHQALSPRMLMDLASDTSG